MFGKKTVLILAIVALMVAGAVMAGTALQITQPVSATISVEGIGDSSPSFNVIDNVFDASTNNGAGAAAGNISANDVYVIDFGGEAAAATGNNAWLLSFGRSQSAVVGNDSDFVLKLQNNYADPLTINLVQTTSWLPGRGELGQGVVIKFMNAASNTAQWTLTGAATPTAWTITGTDLVLNNGNMATFYLVVENDDAVAGNWSPKVQLQAIGD
jgi:hypothetical protein